MSRKQILIEHTRHLKRIKQQFCECGRQKKTFIHMCSESIDAVETFGCPYCDDNCSFFGEIKYNGWRLEIRKVNNKLFLFNRHGTIIEEL